MKRMAVILNMYGKHIESVRTFPIHNTVQEVARCLRYLRTLFDGYGLLYSSVPIWANIYIFSEFGI